MSYYVPSKVIREIFAKAFADNKDITDVDRLAFLFLLNMMQDDILREEIHIQESN